MNTLNDLITQASQHLDAHAFVEAKALYTQALEIQSTNAAALMGMAMVSNRTGEPTVAKDILTRLISAFEPKATKKKGKELKPVLPAASMAALYAQMGIACQLMGEKEEAITYYEKAYALFPSAETEHMIQTLRNPSSNLPIQQRILLEAQAFLRVNRLDEATHLLKIGLEKFPDEAPLLHQLGMTMRNMGRGDQALPLVQQAIILNPDEALYYNDLGMIFQDRGDYQKAITFYKRAISRNPEYAIAYSNMGVAYKRLENIPEAINAYREAIILNPTLAPAHNNLGNLLRLTGDIEGAKRHLKKALELAPGYEDAKKNLSELMKGND